MLNVPRPSVASAGWLLAISVSVATLTACETEFCGLGSGSESSGCSGGLVISDAGPPNGMRDDAQRFDPPTPRDAGSDAAHDAPVTDSPMASSDTGVAVDSSPDLATPADAQTCTADDGCTIGHLCQDRVCIGCHGSCVSSDDCVSPAICYTFGSGRACSFCTGKHDAGSD